MVHSRNHPQTIIISPQQVLRDILLIFIGSILCAIAINGILIPHDFVTGGVTGISLIIHNFIPSINVGLIYLFLNLPLFVLAWMAVGRRFFFFSILGTLSLTFSLLFIHFNFNLEDKMLNALLAGLILGAGAGLCLRSSGSQGGTDILSIMLLKRFSINIGDTILTLNGIVLLLISVYYSVEAVLYTMIVVFVSSKVINLVVTGLSQRKSVFIISSQWEKISQEILKDIRRGVTIINGQGGYTRNEEKILYTVITLTEIGQLKRLVNNIDPAAFVVISDTLEVINYRIGNQPHW
ncbi:MAG: YitT family protein [Proteobacteria bacterium]|nr:YitT family protein [Pseudomonadota bacterium]MBU1059557.1 YitT family protein [Pseudomonadota bacterium]